MKHIKLFEAFVNETSSKSNEASNGAPEPLKLKGIKINNKNHLTFTLEISYFIGDEVVMGYLTTGTEEEAQDLKNKVEKAFKAGKIVSPSGIGYYAYNESVNQPVSEKVYQMTGSYGAKGIAGKVLFAFKKQIERIKYEGDEAATLEDINKVWSKWADKDGAKIIEQEVLKQIKDKESVVYIMATLAGKEWMADDVNGINAPGRPELLVRYPSDFVINIGFADDVDAGKFTRKLEGMQNSAVIDKTHTTVLGQFDEEILDNNIEIRAQLLLTIDAK
jgi:hypothetical protein